MSCSHCSKQAFHETACCGRAYCGEECLKADLIQHDLECVEFQLKVPQWLKRGGQGDVQVIPRKSGVASQVAYGYDSKTIRDKAFYQFKLDKNEQKMARQANTVSPIRLGETYQVKIAKNPRRQYWIVY